MVTFIGVLVSLLAIGFTYERVSLSRAERRSIPGVLLDVGGHRIHVTDRGNGGPAVVILHGAGDSSYSWLHVAREIAHFTRVVTYDRPGVGSSDPGPGPDTARSVEELHVLLEKAGVPGPYVLVGHSLGGLIARLFASRYPNDVAGMVMADSSHELLKDDPKFRQGMTALVAMLKVFQFLSTFGLPRFLGDAFGFFPMYPERSFYRKQISADEYRGWTASAHRAVTGHGGLQELSAALPMLEATSRQTLDGADGPRYGDMPIVVLTNPGYGEAWMDMHRELARRSSNSIHRISDRKGHNIQMPRPELVIDGVRNVVEQVRSRS